MASLANAARPGRRLKTKMGEQAQDLSCPGTPRQVQVGRTGRAESRCAGRPTIAGLASGWSSARPASSAARKQQPPRAQRDTWRPLWGVGLAGRTTRGPMPLGKTGKPAARQAAGRSDFGVSLLAQHREQASPYGVVVASRIGERGRAGGCPTGGRHAV